MRCLLISPLKMVSPEAAVPRFSLTWKPAESCFAKCFEILLQTGSSAPPAEESERSLYKEAFTLLLTGPGGWTHLEVLLFRRGPDVLQLLSKAVSLPPPHPLLLSIRCGVV